LVGVAGVVGEVADRVSRTSFSQPTPDTDYMPDNLTHRLSIGSVDDEELLAVLGSLFPGAVGNTKAVEFCSEQEQRAITLTYKNDVIIDAARGPGLTDKKLAEIVAKIKSAILDEGPNKINRSWLFSYEIVEGTWKYRNQFQIMPAPIHAPQPRESNAEHSSILELSYGGSSDRQVEQVRLSRRLNEIRLLLHLFLNGYVVWQGIQGIKKWAVVSKKC
jgi:hypothetical protein